MEIFKNSQSISLKGNKRKNKQTKEKKEAIFTKCRRGRKNYLKDG